jgi:hypothetical protein
MTTFAPRLAADHGVLLCGFVLRGSTLPRCSGQIGRLAMMALRRDAFVSLDIPGDPSEIRAAAEEQAPAAASVAMFFVLSEGFTEKDGEWRMTRHRRQGDRMAQRRGVNRQATRRAEWSGGDITASSFAPAIPALVRCPECQRVNEVSQSGLLAILVSVARDLNRRAETLPRDVYDLLEYAGQELGFPLVTSPKDRFPSIPLAQPPSDREVMSMWPQQVLVDPWDHAGVIAERLRILVPMLGLIVWLAGGRPVSPEDFFIVGPAQMSRVALPDRRHYAVMLNRVPAGLLASWLAAPLAAGNGAAR